MERVGICFVVLLMAISASEAIRCYSCSSIQNPSCSDKNWNMNDIATIDCSLTGGCSKTKVGSVYTRSCGSSLLDDDCSESNDNVGCNCVDNLCNEATVTSVYMATLALVACANLLFHFM